MLNRVKAAQLKISDETAIFDPEIGFGASCQQDGGIGSPTSHPSTNTMI